MQELKAIYPNIKFVGIGGETMETKGLTSIIKISDIAVVGFSEVLKRSKLFFNLLKQVKLLLEKGDIDYFIPIDYPGFNIKVAKIAHQNKVPVFYYIAPQLWAWGKNRYKKLQGIVKKLLVVFPFEEDFFNKHNIPTEFVGHPLFDNPDFLLPIKKFEERENIIALFPGSRKQEVQKNLHLFAKTAELLKTKLDNFEFHFAVANNLSENDFHALKQYDFNYKLSFNSRQLMQNAKAGIVKTGTTTLEASLLGMNMIMAYKTSASHYLLGKKMINLDYIALPNILLNKEVIPECIQQDAEPHSLANKLFEIISSETLRTKQYDDFMRIRKILGEIGASKKAAQIILKS